MNFSSIVGCIAAVAVMYFSITSATKDMKLFLDLHAIVIVLGGTMTVALLTFSFKRLWGSFRIVLKKTFKGESLQYLETIKQIVELADAFRIDAKKSLTQIPPNSHPFLGDCMRTLVEYGFGPDDLEKILGNAVKGKKKRDQEEAKVWHTMARFPPAFGLLGATLGMIALLQTLGEAGAQDRIGPAMAVALVATFYGLIFANLFFIPIAEKLTEVSSTDLVMRNIIKEGVLLIAQKKHPSFIEEYLKSFLSPTQRQISILDGKQSDQKSPKKAA